MAISKADLVGAWRLVRWSLVYDDGRPDEYPLGPDAVGMIMYTAGEEVSALLSRSGRAKVEPQGDDGKARAYGDTFAYAGRYTVRDGAVYHSIEIATNPALVGFTSTRNVALDGDRLTLTGPDFTAGTQRTQRIDWRRS